MNNGTSTSASSRARFTTRGLIWRSRPTSFHAWLRVSNILCEIRGGVLRSSIPYMMAASRSPQRRERLRALHFGSMNPNLRKLALPAVILGVALIVVAVVYFVEPEHSLPSFFPGHSSATAAEASHHHTKHGIAALVVAAALFAFAWFQTGPKTGSASSQA